MFAPCLGVASVSRGVLGILFGSRDAVAKAVVIQVSGLLTVRAAFPFRLTGNDSNSTDAPFVVQVFS